MRIRRAILLSLSFAAAGAFAKPALLPFPKQITWGEGSLHIGVLHNTRPQSRAIRTGLAQVNARIVALGGTPLKTGSAGASLWVGTCNDLGKLPVKIDPPADMQRPDGYFIHCTGDAVFCIGYDERGCYYGMQTLIQLLDRDGQGVVGIPRVEIVDWPSYRVRLVKNGASTDPALVEKMARLLPRYKINVYALQFHKERHGTWRAPSKEFLQNIRTIGSIGKETGVLEPALFLCPFFSPKIDLTKQSDIDLYVQRLKWAVQQGCRWVEVDFNDWCKWDSLSQAEKTAFGNIGTYMARLTNAAYRGVRAVSPDVGVIVCPSTRWYRGEAKPELVTLCKEIPKDVLVYWTGPVVRSRVIRKSEVLAWTKATGRKPFLWDNTIYSHCQPFWVGYSLDAYQNTFPPDLPKLLAGGIHLNASPSPECVPGLLTFADYMWNPEAYNPDRSIAAAFRLSWGESDAKAAMECRQDIHEVYEMLRQASVRQIPWDKAKAENLIAQCLGAAKRISAPGVARDIEAHVVRRMRAAVKAFVPPVDPATLPGYVHKPLSAGVINGSAEIVKKGRPVNWCLYSGAGVGRITASTDAHSGRYSACLEATQWYFNPKNPRHGPRKWINLGLVHGSNGDGFSGLDAYDVMPATTYTCTFWLKGDVPTVEVQALGWRGDFSRKQRVSLHGWPHRIQATTKWKRYTLRFNTKGDTLKAVIKFSLIGYQDEGVKLGKIWVDDLNIKKGE